MDEVAPWVLFTNPTVRIEKNRHENPFMGFWLNILIASVLNWEELMFEIGLTLALLPPAGEYKVMHASVCLHHAAIPQ